MEAAPRARAAFVTPSHQYPLGMPMSMARRTAILAWARQNEAWVVEDDCDSELRYAGHPFPSLQGLDPSRVVYLGTFSKVLFPALRLGYAVVPPELVPAFVGARALLDRHSSTLDHQILAAYMDEGHFEAHVRRIRGAYGERRTALVAALGRHMPEWARLQPSHRGMHVVLRLPPGSDDVAVAREAAAAGVVVRPVSPMYAEAASEPGLMLGFGGFSLDELELASTRLGQLLRRCERGAGAGTVAA